MWIEAWDYEEMTIESKIATWDLNLFVQNITALFTLVETSLPVFEVS